MERTFLDVTIGNAFTVAASSPESIQNIDNAAACRANNREIEREAWWGYNTYKDPWHCLRRLGPTCQKEIVILVRLKWLHHPLLMRPDETRFACSTACLPASLPPCLHIHHFIWYLVRRVCARLNLSGSQLCNLIAARWLLSDRAGRDVPSTCTTINYTIPPPSTYA
ncbi:hypothetical protein BU24DRAFT_84889 [Aaosphaeria arxii CBS 175.79]|uniref:Uncharacterized protein n=1 Tax=Aaosphaeria arxii CBS 175.79 TaxID=1450172 RepID=A0A6A5X848_9PLEO|nr:uncharacterized protein BU24DRAFT_84889 [Aaosphaeria arxii CBS 175.79]KAF2009215.1 hypothetical protein BU24DRAFT_84889 [Aaosphaeria arxii CBS 175.79]